MARKKRFSALNRALNYLRPIGAADDAPPPDAPTNTPLGKFQQWKKGAVNINYTRQTTSNPGSYIPKGIVIFGLILAEAGAVTSMSKRAADAMAGFGLADTEVGLGDVPADPNYAGDFTPAQAVVSVIGAVAAEVASKITGIKYKPRQTNSYTVPFGQATGRTTYVAQARYIREQVEVENANRNIVFYPEDILDI